MGYRVVVAVGFVGSSQPATKVADVAAIIPESNPGFQRNVKNSHTVATFTDSKTGLYPGFQTEGPVLLLLII